MFIHMNRICDLWFPILFCVLYHCASFTMECHGTAAIQTQTTPMYDVIGHT